MFSLTVRRNFMIAHSLPRPAFGPAQGMHGATFVTEVTFRRRSLNDDSIVLDIGEAGEVLDSILEGLNFKNLDEHPDFAGRLSTTEALAQYVAGAVAALAAAALDRQRTLLIVSADDSPLPALSNALDLELRPLCLVLPAAAHAGHIALRAPLALLPVAIERANTSTPSPEE